MDLAAFPGNSGGPVFIMSRNPSYAGGVHIGADLQFVLGVLTNRVLRKEGPQVPKGLKVGKYESLQLGVVIQAVYMKELLAMLRTRGG